MKGGGREGGIRKDGGAARDIGRSLSCQACWCNGWLIRYCRTGGFARLELFVAHVVRSTLARRLGSRCDKVALRYAVRARQGHAIMIARLPLPASLPCNLLHVFMCAYLPVGMSDCCSKPYPVFCVLWIDRSVKHPKRPGNPPRMTDCIHSKPAVPSSIKLASYETL